MGLELILELEIIFHDLILLFKTCPDVKNAKIQTSGWLHIKFTLVVIKGSLCKFVQQLRKCFCNRVGNAEIHEQKKKKMSATEAIFFVLY